MSKEEEEFLKENCENFLDPVTWESSEYYKVSIDELQAYADKVKEKYLDELIEKLDSLEVAATAMRMKKGIINGEDWVMATLITLKQLKTK